MLDEDPHAILSSWLGAVTAAIVGLAGLVWAALSRQRSATVSMREFAELKGQFELIRADHVKRGEFEPVRDNMVRLVLFTKLDDEVRRIDRVQVENSQRIVDLERRMSYLMKDPQ